MNNTHGATPSPKPQTLIICREDINNPLYPRFWEEICEQFGYDGDVVNELALTVIKAKGY